MALSLLCTTLSAEITETITFSELGIEDYEEVFTVEGTYVVLSFDDGGNSTLVPRYYESNESIHLYLNNSMTLKSTYCMTEIKFTYSDDEYSPSKRTLELSSGTYNFNTEKWTGDTTELTLKLYNISNTQYRIVSMTITYDETHSHDTDSSDTETNDLEDEDADDDSSDDADSDTDTDDSDDENADDGTSDDGTSDEEEQGSDDENTDDGTSDDGTSDEEGEGSEDGNTDDGTSDDGTSDEEGQGSDDENADDGTSDDGTSDEEEQGSDDEEAVVDSTKYYLSGDINDWDASATPFGDADEEGIHTLSLDTLYGEFNVTTNGTWDVCYGSTGSTLFTDSTEYVLEETTNNRCVTVDGTYSDCVISLKANADGTLTLYMTVNNDSSDNVEAAVSNVKTAVTSVADNDVYNLNGQRVDSQTKGILIRNGKKYVNR